MTDLAKILRTEMKLQGLTQKALGDLVGVDQSAIYKIVNGKTLKPRFLPEIAKVLGVSVDYLMGIDERPPSETEDNPRFERMKALFLQMEEKDLDKAIEYLETLASNATLRRLRGK